MNSSQIMSKSHSMLSKIPLTSTTTSITAQLLANLTTLSRQHGQTLFMPCTNMPILHLILARSMGKQLCIWSGTYWRIKFAPNQSKGVDTDICGNWDNWFASSDPSTTKSWSGWIVFYADGPVSWASKLQTQVALSTTEAEYIAMSSSLRDAIPIMHLMCSVRCLRIMQLL